jgi:hypothetical protein
MSWPRHLASLILAALLVAIAAAAAGCEADTSSDTEPVDSPPGPAAFGSPAAPATVPPSAPDGDDGPGPLASASASPRSRATAEAFATAWARPDLPAATWLAGVRPFAAPGYARLLATVDPANIAARTVVGPASVISSTTVANVFGIPTDAGILKITCVLHADTWLVTSVELPRRPP